MRETINKNAGLTGSERRLAALADRTFLRLWSYPNTFNDRPKSTDGSGQEIADLLAVFENNVILFSDKEIGWQDDKSLGLSWARWFRRAIQGSVDQLKGAERWIDRYPDRVFVDKHCTQRLPIPLPSSGDRVFHLVAVAGGAQVASRKYFDDPRGTFMIEPSLQGPAQVNTTRSGFCPFVVGDVNPGGNFIHVLDRVALELVLEELDTVADFTEYLVARCKFLRSGGVTIVMGEEHLLAAYMMNGFTDGPPAFLPRGMRRPALRRLVAIPTGEYETYTSSSLYADIRVLKKQSMLWDRVIEMLTEDVLKGTSVAIFDQQPSIQLSEQALRVMASERRIDRVSLAQSLWGAMELCVDNKMARFVRRAYVSRRVPSRKIGYVFLILPQDLLAGTDEEYRAHRAMMLLTYCLSVHREKPQLHTVVGLALDVFRRDGEIRTQSEDLLALDSPEWTPELIDNFETNKMDFGLMDPRKLPVTGVRRRIKSPFKAISRERSN